MTRTALEERIDQYRRAVVAMREQRYRLDLDIAATDGGIQDCEYWLTQLDRTDTFPVGDQAGNDVVLGTSRTDGS